MSTKNISEKDHLITEKSDSWKVKKI